MNNKPLLLRPSGKDYLWGGRRLNDEFEKEIDLSPLAETWECSTHPEGPCYVVGGEYDGKELAAVPAKMPNSSMVWVRTVPKKKCGQRLSGAR